MNHWNVNKAIQQSLGWEYIHVEYADTGEEIFTYTWHKTGTPKVHENFRAYPRVFSNSLDDMRKLEFEIATNVKDLDEYENELVLICWRDKQFPTYRNEGGEEVYHFLASAEQRAEAYLRWKGLWKDEYAAEE